MASIVLLALLFLFGATNSADSRDTSWTPESLRQFCDRQLFASKQPTFVCNPDFVLPYFDQSRLNGLIAADLEDHRSRQPCAQKIFLVVIKGFEPANLMSQMEGKQGQVVLDGLAEEWRQAWSGKCSENTVILLSLKDQADYPGFSSGVKVDQATSEAMRKEAGAYFQLEQWGKGLEAMVRILQKSTQDTDDSTLVIKSILIMVYIGFGIAVVVVIANCYVKWKSGHHAAQSHAGLLDRCSCRCCPCLKSTKRNANSDRRVEHTHLELPDRERENRRISAIPIFGAFRVLR